MNRPTDASLLIWTACLALIVAIVALASVTVDEPAPTRTEQVR